ncbi:thiamine pyrophosphate-dependent enzyme [Planctomycetota bacterium]
MAVKIKDIAKDKELLAGGHRACAACAAPPVLRMVMHVAGPDTVIGFATGCMEVSTTIYPYTAWRVPYIHCAFENVAATVSGAEAAYQAALKKGTIDKKVNFIAFGGDGGTYDIGLQSLSGAMERGHNMLYVCYDNEAYMNTGIQRSGSTPLGAHTNTSPAGSVIPGKTQQKKDLTGIMAAHRIPYVAQASVHNFRDLLAKVEKALAKEGPAFMNILAPCHRGWRFKPEEAIEIAEMATNTCFWPLFEVEDGEWKLNYKPKEKIPMPDYLFKQGRFAHLKKDENKHIVDEIQAETDKRWEETLAKTGGEVTKV